MVWSKGDSLLIETWIDTAGNRHYETVTVNSDGTIITIHEATDLGFDYTYVLDVASGQVDITGMAVLSDGTIINNVDVAAVIDFDNEQMISLSGAGTTSEGYSVVISLGVIDTNNIVYTYTDASNETHAITSTDDSVVIEHIHINTSTYSVITNEDTSVTIDTPPNDNGDVSTKPIG